LNLKRKTFDKNGLDSTLDRTFSSKLDNILCVQKSSFDKNGLDYVEIDSSSLLTHTKFLPLVSVPKPEVRVQKE